MELLNYLDNTFNLFPNCNLIGSERGTTHRFEKKQKKSHKFCFQCMLKINHQQLEFQQQILEIQVLSHAHNMPTTTLM
jgi:hypothetical protein